MNNYNQYGSNGYRPPQYPHPGAPYYMPPVNPYKRPIRQNANIVAGGLLLSIVLMLACSTAIIFLLQLLLPQTILVEGHEIVEQLTDILYYTLSLGIPCIVMVRWIRIPTQVAFPMRRVRLALLIPAIFLFLGADVFGNLSANFLSGFLEMAFGLVPIAPDFTPPRNPIAIVFYMISVAVLPAILEEMLFRGVIMQSLRRFGDGFALVVSAVLFSMFHGNLVQGPPSLLFGLVAGYFVLRTGSLLTGIIMHFINNFLASVSYLLLFNATDEQVMIFNVCWMAVCVLLGLGAFIYLLITQKNMFRVIPSGYPVSEGQKHFLFYSSAMPIVFFIVTVVFTALYFE